MTLIIGVRFRRTGKIYYFDPADFEIKKDDHVIVETARGVEYGTVVFAPKEVSDDKIVQPLKPVIRIATPEDDLTSQENKEKEREAFEICLEKIKFHELNMKLIDSEYTFDRNKLLFYFTADGRIDFRELVKDLAAIFRTRIELRQIGVRDETKFLGGIGICGRPFCCHTFLSEFAPVSIKMAKVQNLSLNPTKISGICGRLMCCLKNEDEAYEYLNNTLPHVGAKVTTAEGFKGQVQSVSVLKQKVKVIIEKENDEKEVREYPVEKLQFENQHRMSNANISPTLPDEELDENALKELEQLEKEDLEESTTEEIPGNQHTRNGKKPYNKYKKYSKENYHRKPKENDQNNAENDSKENTEKKHYKNNRNGRNNYRNKNRNYKNYKNNSQE